MEALIASPKLRTPHFPAAAARFPLRSGPKVWPALHLFCSVFFYICLCGTSSLLLLLLMCNFFSSFTFAHVEVVEVYK
jgi:hypothetical protein